MLNLRMDANDLVIADIPNEMAQQAFRLIREGIDPAEGPRTRLDRLFLHKNGQIFIVEETNCGRRRAPTAASRLSFTRAQRASDVQVEVCRCIYYVIEMGEYPKEADRAPVIKTY